MGPPWKQMGNLIAQDTEKAEVLYDFFASLFIRKYSSHILQVTDDKGRTKNPPL